MAGVLLSATAAVTTNYHELDIDHFGFESDVGTFKMRYLVEDKNWDGKGPILFYTGNEGDIWTFYKNTGYVTETLAQELKGLVIFAEHRYFGETMPFGDKSYDNKNLRYLTVLQALADYAIFLTDYKNANKITAPVYAFGGSYGGMLASWMRMKYPHVIHGAIAASAPILYFRGGASEEGFFEVITDDFKAQDERCVDIIRSGFDVLLEHRSNATSYAKLSERFNTCETIQKPEDIDALMNLLNAGLSYMAMTDYPHPASFLEPMPAWPIDVACKRIVDGIERAEEYGLYDFEGPFAAEYQKVHTLQLMKDALDVYFNYTGATKCYDLKSDGTGSLDAQGWNYLACTDVPMPMGSDGKQDMFYPAPWNYQAYSDECFATYGVRPRYDWVFYEFGGKNPKQDFKAHSNIYFSNGKLDPWMAGGVLETINDSVIARIIEKGAHHLDLRTPEEGDPESVVAARAEELSFLKKWIAEYEGAM